MELMRYLEDRQYISKTAYLATCTTLAGTGAVFVILRLGASIKQAGRPYLDDYATIAGLIFLIATFTLTHQLQILYNDILKEFKASFVKHPTTDFAQLITPSIMDKLKVISNAWVATIVISNLTTWVTKLPLLLLLIRLFNVKVWLRHVAYAVLMVSLLAIVAVTIWSAHLCNTVHPWTTEKAIRCNATSADGYLVTGLVGLIVDIAIFILPIPVIMHLNVAPKKKMGIAMIFGTGILGIVVSVIGCYWRFRTLAGGLGERQVTILCVVLEGIIAIFVGCLPGYYYVWRTVLSKTGLQTTHPTATGSSRKITGTSKLRFPSRGAESGSRKAFYTDTAEYIQMDTPPRTRQGSTSDDPHLENISQSNV